MELNKGQKQALSLLSQFLKSEASEALLTGAGGTGKSACLSVVAKSHYWLRFIFLAPTNKAAGVLRDFIESSELNADVATVASALGHVVQEEVGSLSVKGSRVISNGETKLAELETCRLDKRSGVKPPNVIVVDEVSMLDLYSEDCIRAKAEALGAKIIWVGDPMQLPPPGKKPGTAFNTAIHANLSEVMRYSGGNAVIAQALRERIESKDKAKIDLESLVSLQNVLAPSERNVSLLEPSAWADALGEALNTEGRSNVKVLAYRNESVIQHNHLVRHHLYGEEAENPFLPGDTLLALKRNQYSKYLGGGQKDEIIFNTGEEAIVQWSISDSIGIVDPYPGFDKETIKEHFKKNAGELVKESQGLKKPSKVELRIKLVTVRNSKGSEWTIQFADPTLNEESVRLMNLIGDIEGKLEWTSQVLYKAKEMINAGKGISADPIGRVASFIIKALNEKHDSDKASMLADISRMANRSYASQKQFEQVSFLTLDFGYGYGMTVHKSQGQSIPIVFLDGRDIMSSPQWQSLLYVGVTRATEKLVIRK